MSFRTNKFVLMLRDMGRNLGLNKLVASYLLRGDYEAKYDNRFADALRQGYCVWDVGANIGYYTRLFSQRIGIQGHVYAFEPSPINYKRLTTECLALENVTLLHCGLGKEDGQLHFQQGIDDLGATSRIVEAGVNTATIDIRCGVSIINSGVAPLPNAIKIDVEGFEYEVIVGLGEYIKNTALHLIGIEVHFSILKDRGLPQVPQKIESLLVTHGFTIYWPDSSHIIALRNT